jgi:hypothetical protein
MFYQVYLSPFDQVGLKSYQQKIPRKLLLTSIKCKLGAKKSFITLGLAMDVLKMCFCFETSAAIGRVSKTIYRA